MGRGHNPLGKTTTVLAGTVVERIDEDGALYSYILEHDTVFSLDCVTEESVFIGGEEWFIAAEAWEERYD